MPRSNQLSYITKNLCSSRSDRGANFLFPRVYCQPVNARNPTKRSKTVSIGLEEAIFDLAECRVVILRTLLRDLDGAHHGTDTAHRDEVQVVQQAIQESRTEGIAAACRILDVIRLHRADLPLAIACADD